MPYDEVEAMEKRNARRDMQNLINAVLDSPLETGPVKKVDGEASLKSFKGANTDVKTRIILQFALDASKGDDKKANFLFKYGGLEPKLEQDVTLDMPVFVDTITERVSKGEKVDVVQPTAKKPVEEPSDDVPIVDTCDDGERSWRSRFWTWPRSSAPAMTTSGCPGTSIAW